MKVDNYAWLQINWSVVLILAAGILTVPQVSLAQRQITVSPNREEERLTIHTDLITLNVSVTDRYGRAVTGLGKDAFTVFDNGVRQEIHFFSDEDAPASVSIVFDTSGSMSDDKIKQAKKALARFIQTSQDKDEFFLIDFNSRARLLLDKSRDGDAVLGKLTYVQPQGNTALYDAVYFGIEKVMRGAHPRKIVIVISDGEDNDSRRTFKEVKRQVQESDAIVYAVGFGGFYPMKGSLNGRSVLKELTATSGGKAFFPGDEVEMDEAFERIALEIRRFYSISYYPSDFKADGKKHRLKIKVTFPAGTQPPSVRGREAYFAGVNK
jgi:Ca-activated chloride channel family protein